MMSTVERDEKKRRPGERDGGGDEEGISKG